MSRFKNDGPVMPGNGDNTVMEGKAPESSRSGQEGGNNLPLGLRNTERPPTNDIVANDTANSNPARDLAADVHDEVIGYLIRPEVKENKKPILPGEKFMVVTPNAGLAIFPGMIFEVSHDTPSESNVLLVITEDERGRPRSILVDKKVLLEETIRLSVLEVN